MESLAAPNTCYVSESTSRLASGYFDLEDLGAFRVKGVAEGVAAFELRGMGPLQTRFDVSRARGLTRFVGRDDDMGALDAALAQAREGNGQVVGIVAEAGTGKSRLCFEFLERCRADGQLVNVGRAVAHGKNIPFLPILEAFRDYFDIGEKDSDRLVREKIAGRLLLTDEGFREMLPVVFELFGVLDPKEPPPRLDPDAKQKQLFAALGKEIREGNREGALVTLIEDLHWLDPTSEAFLKSWVDAVVGSSALLIVNFRPEYTGDWMSRTHYRQIPLAPLGRDAVRELLDDLIGSHESTRGLATAIFERTGGNPFFTEEVVQSLIESGHLEGERGNYALVTPVEELEVPVSVQALLASRIDRLAEGEKEILQTAAVIGKDFAEPVLVAASGQPQAVVTEALAELKAAEFIYEQSLYPISEYAFKHPLTQAVALGSQLQERRRRTHTAVAEALEKANLDRLDENAALLAHHHEEAGNLEVAARWHRRAAEWVGTSDVQAAIKHWHRVRELVDEKSGEPEVMSLGVEACANLLALGWRTGVSEEECSEIFDQGQELAKRADDTAGLANLLAGYAAIRGLNAGSAEDYVRFTAEAIRLADRTDDRALQCSTRAYGFYANWLVGKPGESQRLCDEVIELAEGDVDLGADVAGYSPLISARLMRARAEAYTRDVSGYDAVVESQRRAGLENGYLEQTLWAINERLWMDALRGSSEGIHARAREAQQRAEHLGVANQSLAAQVLGRALSADGDWNGVLEAARTALRNGREARGGRFIEVGLLGLISQAELGLGHPDRARAAAAEAVEQMQSLAILYWLLPFRDLARAQLALGEPSSEVQRTLDAFAQQIEQTGQRIFEGALHEVRAELAAREGDTAARAAALARAVDADETVGITTHSERLRT
jgi:adenylate cyclase